ncbi:unnamed protein product [Rotaria sp. Silwood1]|nr:unnamed protein product [Rotaria sp. Silwood1]CAF1660487.1 unnamed protein product [Rotaria sp. Silwood1]
MMLNRFCSQIFPKIHDKIKWLHLESSSMKYVLCAANYPNLDTLSLNNIDQKSIQCLFNGEACYYNNDYNCYNGLILPLLYRMLNLEELDLYIPVKVDKTFIDENDLKKNIINRMPRLNQFRFYIRSIMNIHSGMDLQSIEDIQYRFIEFANNNIISYVDYFPETKQSRYHIYSYPSFMPYYSDITNNFPNRLFTYVRVVSLYDEHPFDHEFFLQIQKSFPFMEKLNLINQKPQNHKQSYESNNNNNQNLSIIEYSFLSNLGIIHVHDDYIEQFLFDTKTYFRNNVVLHIKYECLQRVTHNFKRDTIRINCAKINNLLLYGERYHSNSALKEYFPFAKICYPSIF